MPINGLPQQLPLWSSNWSAQYHGPYSTVQYLLAVVFGSGVDYEICSLIGLALGVQFQSCNPAEDLAIISMSGSTILLTVG